MPVLSNKRSAMEDLPWSTCATIAKFLVRDWGMDW